MKAVQIHEGTLYQLLKVLFPTENIHVNVKKLVNIKNTTGQYLECDLLITEHDLCFEFQDSHHYVATWYNHNTQEKIQSKDILKEELLRQKGLSLVVIPCWWDGAIDSLAATILNQRPDIDLGFTFDNLIPLNPPEGYLNQAQIPNVGELMLASFPVGDNFRVSSGSWWMGEKYDGVRCCWVPTEHTAFTRYGKHLPIVSNIKYAMPSAIIDCEIWFGRGQFALSFLLVSSAAVSSWDFLRALSFDISDSELQTATFEVRYFHLLASIESSHPLATVVPRVECRDERHMRNTVDLVIAGGGEGVIMRKMGSLYEPGRSHSLIKVKNSLGDKEAIVTGVGADQALELTLPNGTTFTVPPQSVHIPTPKKGEVVSFSYQGFARRDIPVSPIVFRVRTDVLWEDLVQSEASVKTTTEENFVARPMRHWTAHNMRKFFEKYALSKNADPLLAETWYNTPSDAIRQLKGGINILAKFKGGYYHAVQYLFPEIAFDQSVLHGYMINDISNRRKFFEDFAKERGFDPNVPEHWYLQARKSITAVEGGVAALLYSKGGFIETVQHLFPEIGLDTKRFKKYIWRDPVNRRKFFELYARQNSFDPLVAENWYKQSVESFMFIKGTRKVIYHHKYSVYQALLDLFPNIGLDRSKFVDQTLWQDPDRRRRFFEKFAKENAFDPLIASNWYAQPREHIMAFRGAQGVLFHHDNSLGNALVELFPNIGLDVEKFKLSRWHDAKNRKRFFEQYAKQNQFDPLKPSNWTPEVRRSLKFVKAVKKIISYHNNSVTKALIELFPDIGWKANTKKSLYRHILARKRFLEDYAKANNFDPTEPSNWYSRYASKTFTEKEAMGVVFFHDNSLPKALSELFPNIGIDKSKFVSPKPIKLWHEANNRREFFQNYAFAHSFDPLIAENWYAQSPEKILSMKGGRTIKQYHNSSVMQALIDLFPDIGLDETKFSDSWFKKSEREHFETDGTDFTSKVSVNTAKSILSHFTTKPPKVPAMPVEKSVPVRISRLVMRTNRIKKRLTKSQEEIESKIFNSVSVEPLLTSVKTVKTAHKLLSQSYPALESPAFSKPLWNDVDKRRNFFINYAKSQGFDPLVAENWYSHPLKQMMSHTGAYGVMAVHGNSISTALVELFPNIGLDKIKFSKRHWWLDSDKRREFMEKFARQSGFDPLVPDNWYAVPRRSILALAGGRRILLFYKSVRNAVMTLFPDIGLQRSKFHSSIAQWYNLEDRRKFFENVARGEGFDPNTADTWYTITREQITKYKGAAAVLTYHQSFTQALIDVFPGLSLDRSRLLLFTAKWRNPKNRREFFVEFAKANNFDPLIPAHWYSVTNSQILATRGAHRVIFYHENNISKALMSLFPDIGLQEDRLVI